MLDLMIKEIEVDKSTVEYKNVHKNATINPRSVKIRPIRQTLAITLWKGKTVRFELKYNENLKIYSHSYQYNSAKWREYECWADLKIAAPKLKQETATEVERCCESNENQRNSYSASSWNDLHLGDWNGNRTMLWKQRQPQKQLLRLQLEWLARCLTGFLV